MFLGFSLRYALRDLRAHRAFTFLTLLSMTLGLSAVLMTDHFERSARHSIEGRARELLSCDLEIQARKPLSESDLTRVTEQLNRPHTQSRHVGFYTMAGTPRTSVLARVEVIDEHYPLVGSFESTPASAAKDLQRRRGILLSDRLSQLIDAQNLKTLDVGGHAFSILGRVAKDTAQGQGVFSLAAPLYMSFDTFLSLGLSPNTSSLRYRYAHTFHDTPSLEELEELKSQLQSLFPDPGVRVSTPRDTQEGLSRLIGYLGDYLALVGLVGVFLTASAASLLFNAYLRSRRKDIAVLVALGGPRRLAVAIYTLESLIMGLSAAFLALLIATLSMPAVSQVLQAFVPVMVQPDLSAKTVLLTLTLGLLAGPLFNIQHFFALSRVSPQELFQTLEAPQVRLTYRLMTWAPAALSLWGLSVYVANSWRTGTLFIGALGLATLIAYGIFRLTLRLLATRPLRNHALLNLTRRVGFSSGLFLTLAVVSLLISLVPQIEESLVFDSQGPLQTQRPALFLFDIQPEQLDSLTSFLSEREATLHNPTPLIQARLTHVNASPFDRDTSDAPASRETQRSRDFRNRGFNLTYRPHLDASEELVAGVPFSSSPPTPEAVAQVSLEKRFAQRLGLKMGDVLTFDVSGVPIEGQIISFRRVRWASFQPNFFVVFQPGYLEDAPQSLLATVNTSRNATELQKDLFQAFPGIPALHVESTLEKILGLLDQMTYAMQVASWVVTLAGLAVLIAMIRYQLQLRYRDIVLLTLIGASRRWIFKQLFTEFVGLIGLGTLVGLAISVGLSSFLAYMLFEQAGVWISLPVLGYMAVLFFLSTGLSAGVIVLGIRRLPKQVLSAL